mgnify:CR=1 FL=1
MKTLEIVRGKLTLGTSRELLHRLPLPHLGRDQVLEVWRGLNGTRWFWPGQATPIFITDSDKLSQIVAFPGDAVTGPIAFRLTYLKPQLEHEAWDAVCALHQVVHSEALSARSCITELEMIRSSLHFFSSDSWNQTITEIAKNFERNKPFGQRDIDLIRFTVEARMALAELSPRYPELAEELRALDASYEPIKTATFLLDDEFFLCQNRFDPIAPSVWWLYPLEIYEMLSDDQRYANWKRFGH